MSITYYMAAKLDDKLKLKGLVHLCWCNKVLDCYLIRSFVITNKIILIYSSVWNWLFFSKWLYIIPYKQHWYWKDWEISNCQTLHQTEDIMLKNMMSIRYHDGQLIHETQDGTILHVHFALKYRGPYLVPAQSAILSGFVCSVLAQCSFSRRAPT